MKLQIVFSNHFQALKFHIVGTLFMLIALYFLNFDSTALLVFGCMWVLYTIPVTYLHLKYYLMNKNQEITITNNEIIQNFKSKNESKIYQKCEIEKVVLYKSASLDQGGIPLSAIESYHYIKIFLRNGVSICITNLMTPNLDEVLNQFRGIPFKRKKGIFILFNI